MDTLFWKQCCPDISLRSTKQLSYRQYAYKLVLRVNGAVMLRYQDDFKKQMEFLGIYRRVNPGGSWRTPADRPGEQELCVLQNLRTYRDDLPSGMRMRIEEPHVQFYADDEEKLKLMIQNVFSEVPAADYLVSIAAPKCSQDLELLNQGFVLRRKNDYAFRMHLRDGRYSRAVRKQLLDLLDAQQEQVRLPPNTRQNLAGMRSDYIWGCYFWCQDESLRLLIDMVRPQTIRQIDRFHDPAEGK